MGFSVSLLLIFFFSRLALVITFTLDCNIITDGTIIILYYCPWLGRRRAKNVRGGQTADVHNTYTRIRVADLYCSRLQRKIAIYLYIYVYVYIRYDDIEDTWETHYVFRVYETTTGRYTNFSYLDIVICDESGRFDTSRLAPKNPRNNIYIYIHISEYIILRV